MRRISALISVLVLVAALSAVVCAQDYKSLKFDELEFKVPDVELLKLSNGIVVHFYEDHSLPLVAIDASFKAGEIFEPAELAGLSEICAVVLRSGGSKSIPANDLDQMLDFVGAQLNTYSTTEQASVQLRVLKKDIDLGMKLMSQVIVEPAFEQEKLDIALENKIEEIRRENDNPNVITRREFYRKLFPNHPYGRSATVANIQAIGRSDVVDFHAGIYRPDNCIMAVSGDLTKTELAELLNKYFTSWKAADGPLPAFPDLPDPAYGIYHVHKDINQTFFRIGHPGISKSNPDRYAVEVMNFILGGGGFLSRMMHKVRVEGGLAYNVGTNFYKMNHSGSFYAYCQTGPGTTAKAIDLMMQETRRMIEEDVTPEEVAVARNTILNTNVFQYATPHQIAAQQAQLELDGLPPDVLTKRIEAIRSVTVADIRRVAEKYLHPDKVIIVSVGNEETFDKPLSTYGHVTMIEVE